MYGLYARQSIEKQDSISVESQLEFCRFETKGQPCRTYIDRGFSGKDTHRPGFEALMADIQKGEIQAVVVYKLDRISRSIVDFSNMMEIFQNYGVSFISSTEKFDTSTPIGRAMLNLCAVFAQLERETIQKRVSDAYRSRSQKGFYMGGRVPFGFQVEPTQIGGISTSRYRPVEEEMVWVKKMFTFYAQRDTSLGELARYLKDQGAVTRQGKPFSPARLGELIRNPIYVQADGQVYRFFHDQGVHLLDPPSQYTGDRGCYLYQETKGSKASLTGCFVVLAPHPGIIDSESWLACRRKCLEHRRTGSGKKEKSSWLVGMIQCGVCGSGMAVRKKGTTGTRYLICGGRIRHNGCAGPGTVRVQELEEFIYQKIVRKLGEIPAVEIRKIGNKEAENRILLRKLELEHQIEEIANQMVGAGETLINYLNQKAELLEREKEKLEKKLEYKMEESGGKLSENLVQTLMAWDSFSNEEKGLVANSMIEEVAISNNRIEIFWRY